MYARTIAIWCLCNNRMQTQIAFNSVFFYCMTFVCLCYRIIFYYYELNLREFKNVRIKNATVKIDGNWCSKAACQIVLSTDNYSPIEITINCAVKIAGVPAVYVSPDCSKCGSLYLAVFINACVLNRIWSIMLIYYFIVYVWF